MRVNRILGLLVATATALLITPSVAHAVPYPAEPPASAVSEATVTDGEAVVFSGAGFLPNEEISIEITYGGSDATAAFDADAAGGFVLSAVTLPQKRATIIRATSAGTFSTPIRLTRTGTATLVARGLISGVTVVQQVTVLADDADDADSGDFTDAGDPGDAGDAGNAGDDTTADGGGALPTTGMSGNRMFIGIYGGLCAILIGAGVLWLTRARRRRTTE